MDKLKNGKTITIKINGNNQPFHEHDEKKGLKREHDSLDIESKKEIAVSQEASEESFDWILPEDHPEEVAEYQTVKKNLKSPRNSLKGIQHNLKKKNHGAVKSILFAVIFAVIFGTSIGAVMLKLVITDQSPPAATSAILVENEKPAGESSQKSSFMLLPLSTYIVQGGVFSTKEAADQAAADIKTRGIPSQIMEQNGKSVLILGTASSLDDAKLVGTFFKEKGADFFSKPLEVQEKTITGLTLNEKETLKKAPILFGLLNSAEGSLLQKQAVPQDLADKITQMEQEMAKLNKNLENKNIEQMNNELVEASQKVLSSKDHESLVEIQQHLINFLTLYSSI